MRPLASILAAVALAILAGCTNTRWGFLNNAKDRPVQAPPPKEAVLGYLNDNASRMQTLRCDDLSITVHQGAIPIGLSGKMMTQKPRDFRMSGDALGNRVVDLGSNQNEFWWWISKADPPHQFFCSYRDLEEGRVRAMPFPFQPEWIMQTMGLGPYGTADKYDMQHDDYTIRLTEKIRSPQGQALRKVIVMKREPQKEPNPQVVDYLLLDDATGNELCSAHITQVHRDRATGAIVPRRLELRWPEAKVRLDMKFDGISVNPSLPNTAFVRQQMPGVRSVDLAQMFNNGGGVQPARGILNP